MRIPLNASKTSRSRSPVTMCVALPPTPISRNLLSLGSLQAVIRTFSSTHSASRVKAIRKRRISSSSTYRRNCLRLSTPWSSASTETETSNVPSFRARSRARRGIESGKSRALISTFVSKAQRNYAPLSSEASISGVRPRDCAFRPASSSTCCRETESFPVSSRNHRLRRA